MKQKFSNRAVAIALCLTLALTLFVPLTVSASEGTVVWSLADFIAEHDLSVGDEVPEGFGLRGAGSDITVAAGNSILVERTAQLNFADDWRGIDLDIDELDIREGDLLTLSVRRPEGATTASTVIRQGRTNYTEGSWLTSPMLAAGNSHTFSLAITAEHLVTAIPGSWAANDPETIRVRNPQDTPITADFYITDMKITRGGEAAVTTALEGDLIYSFLDDPAVKALPVGLELGGMLRELRYFTGSGNPVITVVGNPFGGSALRFTERANEWCGLDFIWSELDLANGDYEIKVAGNMEVDTEFAITGSAAPHGWLGEALFDEEINVATGDFEMIREFSVIGGEVHGYVGPMGGNIRLRPMEANVNYSIYQVAIIPAGKDFPALPARVSVQPLPTPTPDVTIPTPPPPTPETVIVLTVGSNQATVDGVAQRLDEAPFIDAAANRTMVPVRFIGEALGAVVGWVAPDGTHRGIAYFVLDGERIELPIGVALPGGMGTPEIIGEGRTFVPARFVAESFGAEVIPDLPVITIRLEK
jgi:hypothetical protein